MSEKTKTTTEVEAAVDILMAAYVEHRMDDYFACFHPEATFLFHMTPTRLVSRSAFREEWDRWVQEDGFTVVDCTSHDHLIQDLGEVAVFTHGLTTTAKTNDGEMTSLERETIVFARQEDGSWLAVHEHLSPDPAATPE